MERMFRNAEPCDGRPGLARLSARAAQKRNVLRTSVDRRFDAPAWMHGGSGRFVAMHHGFALAIPRRALMTGIALFICLILGERRKNNLDYRQQSQANYCEKNNCAYNTDHSHASSALTALYQAFDKTRR
ncbi:hypothetical protein [Caballeronia cordobensis]|uniref:hypothetical protein n=1 Tax=Caballeronia cordobensis TaxID=1353886 RepID=UPI0011781659|nr:hypothetical protein [Caballeronia cordobensis]